MSISLEINIVEGNNGACSVNASGKEQHIITDKERKTFNLEDKKLKEAVEAYFGKKPTDAYLHSPTPWDDLYKSYGWAEVQTVLVVDKAEILGFTTKPIILKEQVLTNNSSKPADFEVHISDEVSETVSSSWSTGGTLHVEETIHCDISFLGIGGGSSATYSYEQSWGIGGEKSKTVSLGSGSGMTVRLDPGESVVAELSANRGVMKIRVHYKAYLIGKTAVNYEHKYKDHHFWGLSISNVMAADDISNAILSTEDMEIGYYADGKVEVKDNESKAVKATFMLADIAAN